MVGRLPTASDFPDNLKFEIIPPPNNDAPTNILLLLHGLGDTSAPFAKLGRQLNLPETACIALQATHTLLDLGGFHWGDDVLFDSSSGGLDPDAGFKESTELLKRVVNDVLVQKCGYRMREVMIFGFGQGGMAALNLAASLHQSASDPAGAELSGVVSIGAGLPAEAPASFIAKSRCPVLVCAGSDQSAVTAASEEKLKRVFDFVEIKRYRRPGDAMPSNRDEMMPIMQFFARRLRSTKGVPAGSVEIS